jgi:hypothetical protein
MDTIIVYKWLLQSTRKDNLKGESDDEEIEILCSLRDADDGYLRGAGFGEHNPRNDQESG